MKMDHDDWVLLNAYADGELDLSEQKRFSSRLAREPDLRAELEQLKLLKSSLAGLHGVDRALVEKPASSASNVGMITCLLLAIAAGAFWWTRSETATTPANLHSRLSAKEASSMNPRPTGDGLDLSGSNLTLVHRVEVNGGAITAWHYRGPSGCALTLASGPGLTPGSGAMLRGWAVDGVGYVIAADGMDAPRFEAIAAYAEAQTRKEPTTGDRLIAMQEKTSRAESCA